MHINFSSEMETYLQSKVSTGFYSNASDVVRDAIRRMWEEDEKVAAFRAAVQVGDAQIERGEGIAYTSDTLKKLSDRARAQVKAGRKVSRDG